MTNSQSNVSPSSSEAGRRFRRPRFTVIPVEDGHELRVVMPGVSKEAVSVQIDGHQLRIEGSRSDRPQAGWRPLLQELSWEDYRLVLELNVQIEEGAISAEVSDGVLHLRLPKAEAAKPRRIEVS